MKRIALICAVFCLLGLFHRRHCRACDGVGAAFVPAYSQAFVPSYNFGAAFVPSYASTFAVAQPQVVVVNNNRRFFAAHNDRVNVNAHGVNVRVH
jgi:hypothetical protein